jgi:hypothetical protein
VTTKRKIPATEATYTRVKKEKVSKEINSLGRI